MKRNMRGKIMGDFYQTKYINEYKKTHYDKIVFHIPKGKKEILKKTANDYEMSMAQLIISAIEKQYHIDISSTLDLDKLFAESNNSH